MKRAKFAVICGEGFGHPNLEQVANSGSKLKEFEGEIISCESEVFSENFYLKIKLQDFKKEINWPELLPIPAVVGQGLRLFYEDTEGDGKAVDAKAYELKDQGKLIRRGSSEYIKFEF